MVTIDEAARRRLEARRLAQQEEAARRQRLLAAGGCDLVACLFGDWVATRFDLNLEGCEVEVEMGAGGKFWVKLALKAGAVRLLNPVLLYREGGVWAIHVAVDGGLVWRAGCGEVMTDWEDLVDALVFVSCGEVGP